MKKYFLSLIIIAILSAQFISCRDDITTPNDENENNGLDIPILKEIIEPSSGDIWVRGNSYFIKWNASENIEKVKIELVRKFDYISTISSSTRNDGEFYWKVPNDLYYFHHYRIKLTPIGSNSNPIHSDEFDIRETL